MKKENYGTMLVLAVLVFAVAIIYGIYYTSITKPKTDAYFSQYNRVLKNNLKEQLENQSAVDEKINDIVTNGEYTLEDPCVLTNPYKISPLSAMIIFKTKEATSIKVTINDNEATIVDSAKTHIIPIYGLYANANNIIKLTTDNNESKELIIKTEILNDNIKEFDVEPKLDGKTHLFMLGALNKKETYLRGFDHNNNLVFYLKFDNITRANFYNEHMQIAYNGNIKNDSNEQNIKLEIDYLGRIFAIHKSDDDLNNNVNLDIEGDTYISTPVNIYSKNIKNYAIKKISDTTASTKYRKLKSSVISEKLINAKTYSNDYSLTINGPFISYDFKDREDISLLLVSKNSDLTYSFDLSNKEIMRTNLKGEYSLYMITNGTYYTLLSTINL